MITIPFHDNWTVRRMDGTDRQFMAVTLPHDAMLSEGRNADSKGGVNTGWFDAHDYEYRKEFMVPSEWAEQTVWIEFEGIYHNAELYVNEERLSAHPNGYIGFKRMLNHCLHFGELNIIRVIAKNAAQPNSRWYTGTGIYRPVWLHIAPKAYIIPESICVQTLNVQKRRVVFSFDTSETGDVTIEALGQEKRGKKSIEFDFPEAELWSPKHPALYTARLSMGEDVTEIQFGIRSVEVDAKNGLRINGERVLLLGACIHHDNGILGAVGHPFAERRKIALLKQAGYNAIRSAHNPVSKAILKACDELGMLVVDEYADMWYIHKTQYDYASYFENNWKADLRMIVEKDRNHPSVIMYSIGNEVSETAQSKGIALTGEMRDYLHELDNRPVTCGINIFFNYLSSLGFGVYSDEKAKKAAENNGKAKKKTVGSEFINNIAGLLGANFMKFGATLHGSDVKTREAYANLDVAGYNYGINRYKRDLKKYPSRVILGSETFASDASAFYDLAKNHPALIGDFAWTGIDYLGEVGLGAWEYKVYAPTFEHGPGWLTAGAGNLDLIGNETCQMAYTQVAFGISPVRIGVVPVKFAKEKHSPAVWRFTNAVESWSWNGCDGMKTTVEVYARGKEAELVLNGKSLGRKKISKNLRTPFHVVYEPGTLTAIIYDINGKETARTELVTAAEQTILELKPENENIHLGELLYLHLRYTDLQGILKPLAQGCVSLKVKGGKLLAFGNACSYQEKGFLTESTQMYYGEAMAVIEPLNSQMIHIQAISNFGNCEKNIIVQ